MQFLVTRKFSMDVFVFVIDYTRHFDTENRMFYVHPHDEVVLFEQPKKLYFETFLSHLLYRLHRL